MGSAEWMWARGSRRWVGLAALALLVAGTAQAGGDPRDLYREGTPVLDLRYRFELVDQDGLPEDAKANTVRTRFGYETGRVLGMGAGFDFEWVEALGAERFNDTLNGNTRFPVVADPDDIQLNQLFFVSQDTVPGTSLKVGRQRIIWDDARFIGNVGFRQNEQTFDAVAVGTTLVPDTAIEYSYIWDTHRIFGTRSPVGSLGVDGHSMRADYTGIEGVTLSPFAILLDFDRASADGLSSATGGATAATEHVLGEDWTLHFRGGLAHQRDYGGNPADFGHWYYRVEPGVGYAGANARLGYEVLEGDGTTAFQTPLATLHKFNGLTDQFLTTPANGLRDLYVGADWALPGEGWLSDVSVAGAYHQYWAEQGGAHYGSEWDVGVFKAVPADYGTWRFGVQFAQYDADRFGADTSKLWVTVSFQLGAEPYRRLFAE